MSLEKLVAVAVVEQGRKRRYRSLKLKMDAEVVGEREDPVNRNEPTKDGCGGINRAAMRCW